MKVGRVDESHYNLNSPAAASTQAGSSTRDADFQKGDGANLFSTVGRFLEGGAGLIPAM